MDIHTLQSAIDMIEKRIQRRSAEYDGGDWEHGVLCGLHSAKVELEYMLETEVKYRESKEVA